VTRLPTGTVTLLLADLEDSTRLVQQAGADYPGLLAALRGLVREAVSAHGGVEVDAHGDEILSAFTDAAAGVAAAIEAQRAIGARDWGDERRVRMRMGVHTGRPDVGEEGYTGIDVHRVARVASAGHGGQILLTASARGGCDETQVLDLGEHRLAGLEAPERLFQLVAEGLPRDLPPLRVAPETVGSGMRVVLADDSILLREGVARLLEDAGFEVAGQSGTAEDVVRHVGLYKPRVAIVDIRMPPTHTDEGLRAAKEIRGRFPATGVLVLSQYVESGYALELLSESAEGVGYLLKDRVSDLEQFAQAVRRVGEGGSALDPAVVSQLVGRRRAEGPLDDLSPREREVLELMAEGLSNLAIAGRLYVTLRAVEKHVTSIFAKLRLPATTDSHRRVLAVLTFLRG
jgi:DNA-binding NarL/FixJ family response regulator/class 3 adenylate cyclase